MSVTVADIKTAAAIALWMSLGSLCGGLAATKDARGNTPCNPSPRMIAERIIIDERADMGPAERAFWLDALTAAGKPHLLEPDLVAAVVATESKFRQWLVSETGAQGAMQVMPGVWLGKPQCPKGSKLSEIEPGLACGTAILRYELDKGDGVDAALRRYNAGIRGQHLVQGYADATLARMARARSALCPMPRPEASK